MSATDVPRTPEAAPLDEKDLAGATPPTTTANVVDPEKLSQDAAESDVHATDIDPVEEKALIRKLDLCIYPILYITYMLSFLDRINISNARIQGLTQDLELTGNRFNIALMVSAMHWQCKSVYRR
jgi:hypothetical protein